MTLRVLVVESDPEEILFLRDVLAELDGSDAWTQWTHIESLFAGSWAEATALLATQPVDVIVLDLDLADSQGHETFRNYQELAPQIPSVLLVEKESELLLAENLLREGAQDFLARSQVDCEPLARAIRNAIGRHRLLAATRATSMIDSLTGLLSREAFLLLADRDRHLASAMCRRQLVILAELNRVSGDAQGRDLGLVNAAEELRRSAGNADLIARVGLMHLAVSVLDSEKESAEDVLARLSEAAAKSQISLGAAVFDPQRPVPLDDLLEQAARDLHATENV
jgi:CheY-like chemotaxis protein